jgi:hypothetical protein
MIHSFCCWLGLAADSAVWGQLQALEPRPPLAVDGGQAALVPLGPSFTEGSTSYVGQKFYCVRPIACVRPPYSAYGSILEISDSSACVLCTTCVQPPALLMAPLPTYSLHRVAPLK